MTRLRHPLIGSLSLLMVFSPFAAAQGSQERLVERRKKKLASAFVERGGFQVDFDQARKEAGKRKQLIFAYYTRSFAP